MYTFYTVRFVNCGLELEHKIEFENYECAYQFITSDYFKMFCNLVDFFLWSTDEFEEFKEIYNS